jgi:hypothetical protein
MGMFNSNVLDIVIGLIFVYLTLAILCTAANEWVAAVTKRRGKTLERGVRQLLADQVVPNADRGDQQFAEEFYRHPLITKLLDRGNHPAYLSPRTFAAAVTDIVTNTGPAPPAPSVTSGLTPDKIETPLPNFAGLPEGQVKRSVLALIQHLKERNDPAVVQQALEAWFNDSMDRVSGWYKRRTQLWTIIIAAALTILVNADTVHIVRQLRNDPVLRSAVIEEAKVRSQKPRPTVTVEYKDENDPTSPTVTRNEGDALSQKELDVLGQMIGWHSPFRDNLRGETFLGWLLTVLAISMGAPFWFDLLNKIMRVRFAGKSPDETAKPPEKPDAEPRV